ncbi:YhcB family protein [Pasteurella oralis]|uniref:Z-ring associated protein G n=1 Tax=Pasteurella oralis TaxID=1071947 RepID=A0ABW4NU30_9PAST|nr:YhcB family protein [Pasteurella oralis]MDO5055589.1 YhcB family protein [Pasteurella oralis]
MQNWTPEMWQTAGIGLIIGLVIGYLFLRFTKDSVKKQVKTEAELQKVKNQLDSQKQQLEKHFAESAELLKNIAQDYQKLYKHLATSSTQLLPELTNKQLFSQELITNTTTEKVDNTDTDEPPRDYSEGSSGLLKNEKDNN